MSSNESPRFTHLHVHSDYSLLTGLAQVPDLIAKAVADGMKSVALTDLGAMYGIIEFYKLCKKNDIKPIVGVEVYIAPNGHTNKRPKLDEDRHSLILLAENNEGYQNLLKLVSISFLDGFYYKPRVDKDLLKKYGKGIIALSSGFGGEISKGVLKNFSDDHMDALVGEYISIFGKDNFFIEILRHPHIPDQEIVNTILLKIAKRNNLGVVAGGNTFYLNTEDDQAHDILLCIQNNRKVFEDNRYTMVGEDYSFMSQADMIRRFKDLPEAIANTQVIADRCNVNIEFGINKLPSFNVPDGFTYESFLRLECFKGLAQRYGGTLDEATETWHVDEKLPLIKSKGREFFKKDILDRLEYELSVIEKTGYASYFLIVSDFIKWSKRNGIMVGPGRGSAAGSMVAYLTEICALDPIAYDLLFERFLNPERISMPDIDTDFADTRRDEVIAYVQEKYGKDKVSGIITFGTLGSRAVIRDVGRALGIEYAYCDKISKLIPSMSDLKTSLDEVPDLKAEYAQNAECKKIIDIALKLEGAKRHASQHACGVLITKDPLTDYVPVQRVTSEEDSPLVSQYSLGPLEDLGLLKMDFLGLKNLTVIENTIEAIEKIHGVKVDIDRLPLDDQKTFDLLKRGETTGVFQFESSGMKRYMKMLQPTELEDLIAMGALYRPGPLDAGMVEEYIERKNGKREVKYSHPMIEPALRDTYGVIVYQEQVMRIARDLAGFTMGQADTLRKAVGKKIKELMDKQQKLLMDGMTQKGVPKNIAHEIWEQIETFARYGFNRSHAACYGMVSYMTAWLKANYPAEYMAALLTSDLDDIDRISVEINECRQMGIDVLLPDVNESFTRFTVVAQSLSEGKPRIRFGLSGIKGVGENIARTIIRVRKEGGPFTSLVDMLVRIQSRDFNKKSLDSLIRSGALDTFGDRNTLLMNMEKILAFSKEQHQIANQAQSSLFSALASSTTPTLTLDTYPPLDLMTLLSWEKELLGFYLSQHPFDIYKEALGDYVIDSSTLSKQKFKGHIRVAGIISSMKKIVTKKGELMMFVTLEDNRGLLEVIVFPSVYQQTAHIWQENAMVIVSGTASAKDETTKVLCNEVKVITKKDIPMLVAGMKKLNPEVEVNAEVSVVIFFNKVVSAPTIDALSTLLHSNTGGKKVYLAVPMDSSKFRKIETNFLLDPHDSSILDKIGKLSDVKYVKVM